MFSGIVAGDALSDKLEGALSWLLFFAAFFFCIALVLISGRKLARSRQLDSKPTGFPAGSDADADSS